MKKIFKIVIFLFFLVLAIFSCAKGIIKQYVVNTVRKSYFYEEQSATIGEILNTITKNGKWSYTTDDGIMVVHFEGNRNDKKMKLSFFITNFAGQRIFKLISFSLGENLLNSENGVEEIPDMLYGVYLKEKR